MLFPSFPFNLLVRSLYSNVDHSMRLLASPENRIVFVLVFVAPGFFFSDFLTSEFLLLLAPSERKEALQSSVTINPSVHWDQTKFETEFCAVVTSLTASITVASARDNLQVKVLSARVPIFTIPSCLATATNLQFFIANDIKIGGFDELPGTMKTIEIKNAIITETAHIPGSIWGSQVFSRFAGLTQFTCSNCNLTGNLPDTIPYDLTIFDVSHNSLSGGFPSGLLKTFDEISNIGYNIRFDASHNKISGAVPRRRRRWLAAKEKYQPLKQHVDRYSHVWHYDSDSE